MVFSFNLGLRHKSLKGYLRYNTIFYNKVALNVQWMNFFIWRKNTVSFSRYLDFSVFVKCTDFKICDVIKSIATKWKLHLCLFLLNPKTYQMKLGKILVCSLTNIFNMFLAQYWRLKTSSRTFYYFIKIIIGQDLAIFNGWHLPFLIVPYSPFQKIETLEFWHNWLLSNLSRFLNLKEPET